MDRLGKLLRRQGALGDEELADVLEHQERAFPFGSLCYVLGYVDEETLVRALSKQWGVPGIVLDQSVIRLACLEGLPYELLRRAPALPVYEDAERVFVAVNEPSERSEALRQIELFKGKTAIPHVALQITLARTLRACMAAAAGGESYHVGHYANSDWASLGAMAVVSEVDASPESRPEARAQEAVIEDVTKELVDSDIISIDETDGGTPSSVDRPQRQITDPRAYSEPPGTDAPRAETTDPSLGSLSSDSIEAPPPSAPCELDLDRGAGSAYGAEHDGPPRALLVDDDLASRNLLVKELEPLGFRTETAASGGDAVRRIRERPPDLVIVDAMLPEIDGFQICRAIKQSRRYGGIPVILMSAVIESGHVTTDVLDRYGADAYFEKPLDVVRVVESARELVRAETGPAHELADDDSFERAMELYRSGRIDEAVEALKAGIEVDPLSAKHRFVLANLFQRKSMLYEAIDEYEATIELEPDYFPALTRLAYLYYKQGFSARAIETWRRSLPHCPDAALRENIEVFMRKLIADMQSESGVS